MKELDTAIVFEKLTTRGMVVDRSAMPITFAMTTHTSAVASILGVNHVHGVNERGGAHVRRVSFESALTFAVSRKGSSLNLKNALEYVSRRKRMYYENSRGVGSIAAPLAVVVVFSFLSFSETVLRGHRV
jgi:hypothetical protein